MRELSPFPGDTDSGATAINERGQIVGWSSPSPDRVGRSLRTVIWENGRVRDLGIATDYGGAQINDRGQIVTSSGVLWVTRKTTDLCALSGTTCSVSAINERGQIVGDSDVEGSLFDQGTLWQGRRRHAYRFRAVTLHDINNRGQMVSTDREGHGVPDRAHLWTFNVSPSG